MNQNKALELTKDIATDIIGGILIAVGESPVEDETPAELAAEATEEAEEAVLLEEEMPK